MAQPLFSVIIPTYNRKESLKRCLASIAAQTIDPSLFEVVVIDDGSDDGTAGDLKEMSYPFALLQVSAGHGGPSRARNAGAERARGSILAFTEDDIVARPDWLANASAFISRLHPAVLEGRTVWQGTGTSVRRFEKEHRLSFIPCNLFVDRSVFNAVGGYDPAFFDPKSALYFREDADFGFRLLDARYRPAIAEDVVVEHPEQFATLRSCIRHSRRYVFDPLLYRKHPFRYRMMIERKDIFGLTVHRPQHYLAIVYLVLLLWILWSVGVLHSWNIGPEAVMLLLCSTAFRYKYQGSKAARLYRIQDTLGFLWVPLVYLGSLLKGCVKFRSFGSLL